MIKKYLFFIFSFSMAILLVFMSGKEAFSEDVWVAKSKDPAFTIWMSGKITRGEPGESTTTPASVSLAGAQYISANNWFKHGNAMYCPWSRKPIIYELDSQGGNYRIGLGVKNFASGNPEWTKPSGFTHFKVEVYVGNRYQGSLLIEASDTQINTAYLDEAINISNGAQEVKFIWTNDSYNPRARQDANIEIHNVLFEKII